VVRCQAARQYSSLTSAVSGSNLTSAVSGSVCPAGHTRQCPLSFAFLPLRVRAAHTIARHGPRRVARGGPDAAPPTTSLWQRCRLVHVVVATMSWGPACGPPAQATRLFESEYLSVWWAQVRVTYEVESTTKREKEFFGLVDARFQDAMQTLQYCSDSTTKLQNKVDRGIHLSGVETGAAPGSGALRHTSHVSLIFPPGPGCATTSM
jgi:hypothetical protein